MSRFTHTLPDPVIAGAVTKIRDRVASQLPKLASDPGFFDAVVQRPARRAFALSLAAAGASEGTLWVLDDEGGVLVPCHNTGPDAETLVQNYRHPLERGIIGTVIATQRGISESFVYQNAAHDSTLNRMLGNITVHMIAVPWFVGGDAAGVVSAVKLRKPDEADPPAFDTGAFEILFDFASLLGGLATAQLMEGVFQNQ